MCQVLQLHMLVAQEPAHLILRMSLMILYNKSKMLQAPGSVCFFLERMQQASFALWRITQL